MDEKDRKNTANLLLQKVGLALPVFLKKPISIPLDGVDAKKVIIAAENGRTLMKMKMQWESTSEDSFHMTIRKSGDLVIAEYLNGAWHIVPFTLTVVPEAVKLAKLKTQLPINNQELRKITFENAGDLVYFMTFFSDFPIGIKFDPKNGQLLFLLTKEEGFVVVRPQFITLAYSNRDPKRQQRVGIRNDQLPINALVEILNRYQQNRMSFPKDAKGNRGFYMMDATGMGPKLTPKVFAHNQNQKFFNREFYEKLYGNFSIEHLFDVIGSDAASYTEESFQKQWKWNDLDSLLQGNDPWTVEELDFPAATIELMLFENHR